MPEATRVVVKVANSLLFGKEMKVEKRKYSIQLARLSLFREQMA
jgi:hypothetical protein